MKHTSQPQSIAWFQDHYKAGRLELRPPFQRKPVWTDKQRCFLIESILLDVPVPEVYVQVTHSEDGTQQFGVVDGQQRLRTILQFVGIEQEEDQVDENNNGFVLDKLTAQSRFKDQSFADLPGSLKKHFFQYEVCVRFLHTEDQRLVEDVFKRLNKFTLPLRAQELRNATFHGAFAKLSEQLADNEYWAVNRIISPAAIRRMADIEMMSDLLIGLIHGPQGGSAKIIDEYYEQYEQYDDEFPGETKAKRTFLRTLELIEGAFPDISEAPRWSNKADFYSLFVCFGNLLKDYEPPKALGPLAKALNKFAEEVDQCIETPAKKGMPAQEYAHAVSRGSNDRARRADRHEILTEIAQPLFKARA